MYFTLVGRLALIQRSSGRNREIWILELERNGMEGMGWREWDLIFQ